MRFSSTYVFIATVVIAFIAMQVDTRAIAASSKKKTSQKVFSVPKRKNNIAVKSPLTQFCQDLLAECYNVALNGVPSGIINVQHVCKQNGKGSYSYTFQCIVNNKDVTKQVMNALGGGMTFTSTQVSTILTTATVNTTQVNSASITNTYQATVSTSTTSLGSITTTITTPTTVTATVSVTTATPVTLTTISSTTITATLPSTVTQTQTSTIVSLGTTAVNVLHVSVATAKPAAGRRRDGNSLKRFQILGMESAPLTESTVLERRLVNTDNSVFCKGFSSTCSSQCISIRSKSLLTYCHSGAGDTFTLACLCTNGKDVTQQVLLAEAEKPTIKTISTISTQTSTLTASFTSTATQTYNTTVTQTTVQTIPTTLTLTSTATTVVPVTLTSSFTTPTTVETQTTPTTILTTVYTPVATATATLTTKLVLAPTGYIGLYSPDSSISYGVAQMSSNIQGWLSPTSQDPAPAVGVTFMAVQDPASGAYQLQTTDGSQNVLIALLAAQSTSDFEPASFNSAYLQIDLPSVCGPASQSAAPAAGSDSLTQQPCETFIFQASQDANTFNTTTAPSLLLSTSWMNPSNASTATYMPAVGAEDFYTVLAMTSNVTAFDTFYTDNLAQMSLRFPA